MAWGDWIDVGIRGELLWENTNVSTPFAGQYISPSFSGTMGFLDYKFIMIVAAVNTGDPNTVVYFCTKINKNDISFGSSLPGALCGSGCQRLIEFTTASKIYITDAVYDGTDDIADNCVIPTKIIGFRNDITDI